MSSFTAWSDDVFLGAEEQKANEHVFGGETNAYGPRCFVSTVGSCVDGVFARTRRRDARVFSRIFPFENASSCFFCVLTSLPGEARW